MRLSYLPPCLALALLAGGCSQRDMLHTTGRIVKGGAPFLTQPGEGMRIFFVPTDAGQGTKWDVYAALYSAEDGTFKVIGKDGRGLPPGNYRIALEWLKDRNDLFHGFFGQAKSPITCEVASGMDEIVIDLDQYRIPAGKKGSQRPPRRPDPRQNSQARGQAR
jgi:hypothetical protein